MRNRQKSCPKIIAIAGPNGAGKTFFYYEHLSDLFPVFINADEIAKEKGCDTLTAAKMAEKRRQSFVKKGKTFVFETVLSEKKSAGGKIEFLRNAEALGYDVKLVFIGLDSVEKSQRGVSIRVSKGGHDVPVDKLKKRFPRCMKNLARAIKILSLVDVFDNSVLGRPHQHIASFVKGRAVFVTDELPTWFRKSLSGEEIALP
jgi:predicted ABC-type ATPase